MKSPFGRDCCMLFRLKQEKNDGEAVFLNSVTNPGGIQWKTIILKGLVNKSLKDYSIVL